MKLLLTVAAFCLLVPTIAEARIPGPCVHLGHRACGCTASVIAFGRPMPGLNAVRSWYRFPRSTPHVGAAAIWPGRHVEIVTAVHNDGTVSTTGSVGFNRVPINRLQFVEAANNTVHETQMTELPRHQRTRYATNGHHHRRGAQVASEGYDGGGAWI